MDLNVDSFNRLSLGIIEKFKITPAAAIEKLSALKLNLICGEEIISSIPLQAALVTAVNSANRAFLGGVFVEMPISVNCLLPWPGNKNLNEIVMELGGIVQEKCDKETFSLTFGIKGSIDDNSIQVVCDDWRGGILADGESFDYSFIGKLPIGGVFAGGLAIALAFFRSSGINISACDKTIGLSLWRPDLHWLHKDAVGPKVSLLPKKYWLLGLGHLGQAYLWNIGLLPYNTAEFPELLLNDYDKLVSGNWSAGLLTNLTDNGHKTRLCSKWLKKRGFETIISERLFDENTKRTSDEPFLALCGFDNAKSRHYLENAGFDLVIEAGLGARLQTFDIIALHTFPDAKKSAKEIWPLDEEHNQINQAVLGVLQQESKEVCGIVPLTIAGKSLSASFVGACTGAIVIAELLRALHGGRRYDKMVIQLRNLENLVAAGSNRGSYGTELSRSGWYCVN